MKLQKAILKRYESLKKNPTIRDIAIDTGIQMTRVFRIMNGSEMKLSEYEVFKNKVTEENEKIEGLVLDCERSLSQEAIHDVLGYIERKMTLSLYTVV